MSLLGRPKVHLNAKMQAQGGAGEPTPSPRRQMRGFDLLCKPQNVAVEAPRPRLAARRHGELHVVQGQNLEGGPRHCVNLDRADTGVSGRG